MTTKQTDQTLDVGSSRWPILATALGSAALVSSEFLPAGVLPRMAADLGVSEGTAGLAVSATAIAGAITAPTIAVLFPRGDRRTMLVWLLLIGTVANLAVAAAPTFEVVLLSRVVLGLGLAGFWALSFGAAVRATGGRDRAVSTALAFGVSLATVIGVPIGSMAGDLLSWRLTFVAAAVVTTVAAITIRLAFPPVPAAPGAGLRMLREVAARPRFGVALLSVALLVIGNFAAYPYIRIAIDRLAPQWSAGLLVVWGVGAIVGSLLAGALSKRILLPAVGAPVVLAAALIMVGSTTSVPIMITGIVAWGIAFNMIPVVTLLWVTRADSERAEAATSLQVMTFQIGITVGAAVGGALLDSQGVPVLYGVGAVAILIGALGFGLLRRPEAA